MIAPIKIVDVVVPSPANWLVLCTLFLIKAKIASWSLSFYNNECNTNSRCLTTVTPSFVILGAGLFYMAIFLPLGPKVIPAISAIMVVVLRIYYLHFYGLIIFLGRQKQYLIL